MEIILHTNRELKQKGRKMSVLLLYLKVEGVSSFFTISPHRRVEAGGKPDFPKGFTEDLVFIVYILKIDAVPFGDFINPSTSSPPSTAKIS